MTPCALAYLLVSGLCAVGLIRTMPELSVQNVWLAYSVAAVLACAVLSWLLNIRLVRLSVVDAIAATAFAWYIIAYCVNDSIAVSTLCETCVSAVAYVSLRVLLASHRGLGKWLLVALFVCGIIEAVTGLRQAFGITYSNHNLFRVTGTFFNPGPYGGYLAVILSLSLGSLALTYGYVEKILNRFKTIRDVRTSHIVWVAMFLAAFCAAIAIAVILPATMSRAAFISTTVAIIAITLSNSRIRVPILNHMRQHRKISAIIGVMSLIVVCGGAYGIYVLKKDSADGRLLMWKMATKVMVDNPLTGVGQGYYRGAYGDAQAGYFSSGERSETEINIAGSPEYGFNEYLQIGAETGVSGLILFILLVSVAMWRLFKAHSPYVYGFVALMVFAFFSYPFSLPPMRMLFVIMLAVAGSYSAKRRKVTVSEKIIVGTMMSVGMTLTACIMRPYIERIEATEKWQELRRWYSMEMYSAVVEDYASLLPLMGDNPAFLFEYGRSLNQEGRYVESNYVMSLATRLSNDPMNYNVIGNNYKALGEYDKAAEAYLKASHIVPSRIYPLYLLAKMYSETGDREKAVLYARRVVEMTPKIPSPATADMQREMCELLECSGN